MEQEQRHKAETISQQSLALDEQHRLLDKLAMAEQDLELLTRELHRLRLENAYMGQSKQLSVGGMLLIERVHDVIARAFRDERIYNLLDLRAMVIMACQLAKPEFSNDLNV